MFCRLTCLEFFYSRDRLTFPESFQLGVSNFDIAFAETDKELRDIAKEAFNLKEQKEQKEKEGKKSEAKQLKAEYDQKIKKLNEHGLATEEQFEKDPMFWLNERADYLFPTSTENQVNNNLASVGNDLSTQYRNNFAEVHDHCGCGTKLLKFMAGYKYVAWGITWVNYSDDGWSYAAKDQEVTSTIDIYEGNNVDGIMPIHLARGHGSPVTINWHEEYESYDQYNQLYDDDWETYQKYFSDGFTSHSDQFATMNGVDNDWTIDIISTPSNIT